MLSIQRPGNVSWLMQACWQPRPTLWGQSGAGKGNLTEGIWDDRHPGTAGWQVCVCARWLEGSKWKLMVVQTPKQQMSRSQIWSRGQSERTTCSWCTRLCCTVRPESELNCLNTVLPWAGDTLKLVVLSENFYRAAHIPSVRHNDTMSSHSI